MAHFEVTSLVVVLIVGGLTNAQITSIPTSTGTGIRSINSTLFNCTVNQYQKLIQSIASKFESAGGQPNFNQIVSLLSTSNIQEMCQGLDSLEACIRDSPLQDADMTIQQYINYTSIVPTTRRFFCSAGFERRLQCLRQTANASFICGSVFANTIGQQQSLGPNTLCPLIDTIINCNALHMRQCDRQAGADYLLQRDMLTGSCRGTAESVQLATPFNSKIIQCSFSLVGRVVDLSNTTAISVAFSNISEFMTTSIPEIVRGVCGGIDQVIDCIASEVESSTHEVDVLSKEILDVTNAAQMKRAVAPVCNFARTRLSDVFSVMRCNVSSCLQPVIASYAGIDRQSGPPSGVLLRSTLCGPLSQAVRCASAGTRSCNADVSSLMETFSYDVMRTDCGGRRGNASTKMASNLVLVLLSVVSLYWV